MLCLIAVLAVGCFRPASTDPQQPTIGSDRTQPTEADVTAPASATPPPTTSPPPGQPTMLPIAATATALVATSEAGGTPMPTQPPGSGGSESESAAPQPGQPGGTPTPADATPLYTPTQFLVGPAAGDCIHEVQAGETLFTLAQTWGTTVDEIATLNNIANPNAVAAGTELRIPGCADGELVGGEQPSEPAGGEPTQPAGGGGQTYVVQAGDTVFGIARRFGVTAQAIIDANPALQANPDQLSVGQELIIP
ncbi:MAG: LysM peptidoglycan-binding domain-containing protein [Anaerolineae bacterium]|nr:LysM peptidoglycan-binding domain-containing protein [Anaerolineae bacterium]